MNIFGLGLLAYAGTQFYKKANRKAFTLNVFIPEDWYVVEEGMYHSAKTQKAIVILKKTPEEIFEQSSNFEQLPSSLPGKIVKTDETFIYFLVDQKHDCGYVIGFKNMTELEIGAFCATIRFQK